LLITPNTVSFSGGVNDMAVAILIISIILQFCAAGLALNLIRKTGRVWAWVFIATALFLMGVRRLTSFVQGVLTDGIAIDPIAESVALMISCLMLVGVWLIGDVFSRLDRLRVNAQEELQKRKEAQKDLRQSEQSFRQLADALPQLVWTADSEGNVDYLNQRYKEFEGFSQQADGGWNWVPAVHPEDKEATVAAWQEAFRKGETYQMEHRIHSANDSFRWHLSRAIPVHDETGRIIKWFGTATDIHDLKQAEQELKVAREAAEAATRAKSEFLANMSHEIRTPMTVFLGTLEHLQEVDENPEHRNLLQMAEKAGETLLDLISDILDFSRVEAGKIEIKTEPFDVRSRVNEVVELFALAAANKGLQMEKAIAKEVPAIIVGDETRLGQVLTNLVSNALKFTRQGKVRVSVRTRGDDLEFAVADTGIGIPQDKQHLLFQSFSQINSSGQRPHGGSGLGLAISKRLVELMGGEIAVRSQPGEGSVFTFTTPLEAAGNAKPPS